MTQHPSAPPSMNEKVSACNSQTMSTPSREEITALELYNGVDDETEMEAIAVAVSWKENGKYYWTRLPAGSGLENPNLDGAKRNEIPNPEECWGKWDEMMLEAPNPLPGGCYIKKPRMCDYAATAIELEEEVRGGDAIKKSNILSLTQTKAIISSSLQRDAMMHEVLRHHPHKHLAKYHGCIREGDRYFSGICLERYDLELFKVMNTERNLSTERITEIIQGIRAGLEHLHSLGYAHNDVTPGNIMIDEDSQPVLVDFDSARKLGEVIGYKSLAITPGYMVPESDAGRVEAERDFRQLDIIEREMREGKGPFSRVDQEFDVLKPVSPISEGSSTPPGLPAASGAAANNPFFALSISLLIGIIAASLTFMDVVRGFFSPQTNPPTVIVLGSVLFLSIGYYLRLCGVHWFTGAMPNIGKMTPQRT